MIRPCLGLLSLAELSLCIVGLVLRPYELWSWWLALTSILAEPVLCYVFAAYIAMRGVLTTMEMTARLMALPMYYAILLTLTWLRVDLHSAKYLNKLIHYNYTDLAYANQLLAHVLLFTLPQLAVLVLAEEAMLSPLSITTLVLLSLAFLSYLSTFCGVLRSHNRLKATERLMYEASLTEV
jgi:hypothetical protein